MRTDPVADPRHPATGSRLYPTRRARHAAENGSRARRVKPEVAATAALKPRHPRRGPRRRFSALVGLGFATTLLATYALPANAQTAQPAPGHGSALTAVAAVQVLPAATGKTDDVVRDGYTVTAAPKPPPPPPPPAPAAENTQDRSAPSGAVQWPFPMPVRISSGFGGRNSPCAGCSSDHQGLDLNPGAGTPIHAIADGIVTQVGNPSGGFGVYALIDHEIDGQRISSLYAHMENGSLALSVGERVAAGQPVGLVGNTGASVGAHLHLEIHRDGSPIDPYPWMTAHAG